ncbi:MAG: PHP domain-containing protein [Candidatus Hydrogenedentes bacterium]|nr:PHP domain-containing protein [Candidatus Hydrogenedentota bacterium]
MYVQSSHPQKKRGCLFRLFKWTAVAVCVLLLFGLCLFGYVFRGAMYNRVIAFPKEMAAWEAIRADRTAPGLDDGWTEFRGVCHSHSELSHDSEVPFPEILEACKTADIRFLCMSDHCSEGKADFSKGWSGLHDGVLFIRGYEMSGGFMPWGLPPDTVLDCEADPAALAQQIEVLGGVLFIAHSEEERPWHLPQIRGMEIYNIHTDLKNVGLPSLGPDIILSLKKYPELVMRQIFERQTDILKHWDELNRGRMMAGIAAGDAHQNNGFRGYYTANDTFLLRATSDDTIGEWDLNFLTRPLLSMFFGSLEPGKQLFRIDLDKYERSLRFSSTHVLAADLTQPDILDALSKGRSFIAFDMIADARGFVYFAQAGESKWVMGEEAPLQDGLVLRAASPNNVRFTLVLDGKVIDTQEGRAYQFRPGTPGKYRLEAELFIVDEWVPWVYTNPILVVPAPAASPEAAAVSAVSSESSSGA